MYPRRNLRARIETKGGLDDKFVINNTAFSGYPWPELGDLEYKHKNEIRLFDRWTVVTHPLKEDFMLVETVYCVGVRLEGKANRFLKLELVELEL